MQFHVIFRGHKTRINRQFRQAILDSESQSSTTSDASQARKGKRVPTKEMFSNVNRVECEEALVRLQLKHGCVTRMCNDVEELAFYIYSLTKALSEAHYQYVLKFGEVILILFVGETS